MSTAKAGSKVRPFSFNLLLGHSELTFLCPADPAFPVEASHFALYKRTRHVLTESLRVLKFKETCDSLSLKTEDEVLAQLAEIMNESQESCRDDFDCTCHLFPFFNREWY